MQRLGVIWFDFYGKMGHLTPVSFLWKFTFKTFCVHDFHENSLLTFSTSCIPWSFLGQVHTHYCVAADTLCRVVDTKLIITWCLTSKSFSWCQKVGHYVKNMSWRQKVHHNVTNTSWRQKYVMTSKSLSWRQKYAMTSKSSS